MKQSGLLIFLAFILSLSNYFLKIDTILISSILIWCATIFLFRTISNKTLLYSLIFLTFVCFIFNYLNGFEVDFKKALSINLYLMTLLIGVGFLGTIATPNKEKIKELPKGKKSFLKTYLGIHLFGSVINLSSLILVANRFYKDSPLSKFQIIVLTRAFASDAYWSPFFVSFAAALTYAPNLDTFTILFFGLLLAFIAFIITYFEISKNKEELENFKGYPIHFETLYLPFSLAFLVLITNYYFTNIKIIMLVSLFSLLLCIIILPFKTRNPIKVFTKHINEDLPKMRNELALFLIAGAFGVMISSALIGLEVKLPFEKFDAFSASVLLLILIVLSFVGIHPIISIAVIGTWMQEINHTLLAVTFLMSWATAVSTSPFSGLNLTMQSRYNIKAIELFKVNIFYTIKIYFICVVLLFILSEFLEI